jgi:tetratricopeptide (TPR) repeat protein
MVVLVFVLGGLVSCATSTDSRTPEPLQRARQLMRSGKLQRACDQLEELVQEGGGPKSRQLETLRSWVHCLSRIGQLERARRVLTGIEGSGGGRLYASALVEVAESPAGFNRALDLLARAQQKWPSEAEIPYRAAVLLMANEEPARALVRLEQASRLDDTAAIAAARAHALLDLGRTDEAMKQVRRVPLLDPEPLDLKRGRALIQRITRRSRRMPEQAMARFQEALDRLHLHDQAGLCIQKLEELLMDFPRLAAAHTLLGLAHVRLQNNAAAVVALTRAAALNPLDATNPIYLARIYQNRGRLRGAAHHYREGLKLDPFAADAARELGRVYLKLDQPQEAARVLRRALAIDGGSELSLRLAGRANLAAGKLTAAQSYFLRIIEGNPGDFETNLRLGQILLNRYSKEGKIQPELVTRASDYARRAARVRPEDPELEHLIKRLERLGREPSN